MTESPMNGAAVEEEVLPSLPDADAAPPPPNADALIDAQIAPIIGVMVRGLISGAPNIPAHIVLNSIARQTAKMLAMSVAANPIDLVVKARRDFQDSFRDGIGKVSILAGASLQPQPPPKG